jgi:hypothetical protein
LPALHTLAAAPAIIDHHADAVRSHGFEPPRSRWRHRRLRASCATFVPALTKRTPGCSRSAYCCAHTTTTADPAAADPDGASSSSAAPEINPTRHRLNSVDLGRGFGRSPRDTVLPGLHRRVVGEIVGHVKGDRQAGHPARCNEQEPGCCLFRASSAFDGVRGTRTSSLACSRRVPRFGTPSLRCQPGAGAMVTGWSA